MRKYGSKRKKGADLSKGSFSAQHVQMASFLPELKCALALLTLFL
jgi:hypothetical protein